MNIQDNWVVIILLSYWSIVVFISVANEEGIVDFLKNRPIIFYSGIVLFIIYVVQYVINSEEIDVIYLIFSPLLVFIFALMSGGILGYIITSINDSQWRSEQKQKQKIEKTKDVPEWGNTLGYIILGIIIIAFWIIIGHLTGGSGGDIWKPDY